MNFIHAIILGIVEGITEFLPISSTGHLILASTLLGLQQTEFQKTFEIAIQLGAIFSVVVIYFRSLIKDFEKIKKVITAFLPTAVIGLLLYKVIKQYLIGNVHVVIASLFIGGIIIILFEWKPRTSGSTTITYLQAFLVGIAQCFSMIPGVSRSAATIIGGLAQGIERKTIVEFSFLLAIPTMAAATGLDVLKTKAHFSMNEIELLAVGFIVSFVVAFIAVKWLLRYVQSHTLLAFGVYRIIIAIVAWFLLK